MLPHEFFNLTHKEFKNLATARHKRITDDRRVAEYHSALICAVLANITRPKNGKRFSNYTINKNIGRLKTFFNWMKENKYHNGNITLAKLKTPKRIVKALTTKQIRALFKACPSKAWRIRILLSLVTGLRKSDIDSLLVSQINLQSATIDSKSQKTQKVFMGRPLPRSATGELHSYIKSLSKRQVRLFEDVNVRKNWDKIRGDSGITRQDLRITFSTLIQKIGSLRSAQTLLEHFDDRTTTEFYTDTELILRWKVNQLPVEEWLKS